MMQMARRNLVSWRTVRWGFAGALVLLPLIAMLFTHHVNWTVTDFIFASVLLGGVGLLYGLTVRQSANHSYRGGVAAALVAAFLTIWANGAVGVIGSEDNRYNFVFTGVILLAFAGSIIARFRSSGMALAMAIAGIAQAIASIVGTMTDVRGGLFSSNFTLIWLLAAALFYHAARRDT